MQFLNNDLVQLQGQRIDIGQTGNWFSGTNYQIAIGNSNDMQTDYNTAIGSDNVMGGWQSTFIGIGNQGSSNDEYLVGNANKSIKGSKDNYMFGETNDFSAAAGSHIDIFGSYNTGLNTTDYSMIAGFRNTFDNATFSGIYGSDNSITKADGSYILGSNIVTDQNQVVEIGVNNKTKSTFDATGRHTLRGALSVFGGDGNPGDILVSQGSTTVPMWVSAASLVPTLKYYAEDTTAPITAPIVTAGTSGVAIGDGAVSDAAYAMTFGANSVNTASNAAVVGNGNQMSADKGAVVGIGNVLTGSGAFLVGKDNNLYNYTESSAIGLYNTGTGTLQSMFLAGNTNSLGLGNLVDSQIIGNNNQVQNDLYYTQILGTANTISPTTKLNTIVGNNNTITSGDVTGILGHNNTINTSNAFAIGRDLTNIVDGTVDIGTSDATKVTIDNGGRLTLRGPLNVTGSDGNVGDILISQGSGAGVMPVWGSIGSLLGATATKVATFNGDIDVTGTIDPTRLLFTNLAGVNSPTYNPSANGNAYRIEFAEGGDLNFKSDTTADILHLKNNGRVGIGTSAPTSGFVQITPNAATPGLYVSSNFNAPLISLNNISAAAPSILITDANASNNGAIDLTRTTPAALSNSVNAGVSVVGNYQHFGGNGLGTGVRVNVTNNTATTGYTLHGVNITATANTAGNTVIGIRSNVSSTLGTAYAGIFTGGNVGIGTTTPGNKLEITKGVADQSGLRFTNLNSASITSANNGLQLSLNATGDVILTQDATAANKAWSTTGNTGLSAATNFMGTIDAVDVAFRTSNTEKMRLFSIANPSLGLGVASLASVNGGASSYSGGTLFLPNAGNISGSSGLDIILDNDNNSASGSDFRIRTNGDGAAGTTDLLTVLETGNVGVGIAAPAQKLDVNGAGLFRNGATALATTGTQILFGFAGTNTYQNSIKTRHDAGSAVNNAIDFYVWKFGTDAITTEGTNRVMSVTGSGVGVGTAAPTQALDVVGNIQFPRGSLVGNVQAGHANNGTVELRFGSTIATAFTGMSVLQTFGGTFNNEALTFSTHQGGASVAERMRIDPAGRVGIGTNAPTAQLHTTGTVRFQAFGAGTLQTDANGNLSVSSDERLKNIQGGFNRGLSALQEIQPIAYHWKQSTGYDTEGTYYGFSAQNVQANIPEAVGEDNRGYLTISDRPILATVVNATKELAANADVTNETITTINTGLEAQSGSLTNLEQTLADNTAAIESLTENITSLEDRVTALENTGAVTTAPTDGIFTTAVNFMEDALFDKVVTFKDMILVEGPAVFSNLVQFNDTVVFNKDAAGHATIASGDSSVEVTFDKPYPSAPVVTVTARDFLPEGSYRVTHESATGFTIELDPVQARDIDFAWSAIQTQ
jgi:hypothetical protein